MPPSQTGSILALSAGFLIGLAALLALFAMLEAGSDHAQKVSLLLALGALAAGVGLRRYNGRRQAANLPGQAVPVRGIEPAPTPMQPTLGQSGLCRGRREGATWCTRATWHT